MPPTPAGSPRRGGAKGFDNTPAFRYRGPVHEALATYGYAGLFALGFLASTLLPLGSEWLLVLLLLRRSDPVLTVAVATAGNVLGGCTTYLLGRWGGPATARWLRMTEAQWRRATERYRRFGSWSLLLSWLPVIGDPLCLAGGMLRVGFARFLLLVTAGKAARYAVVAWLTLAAGTPAGPG